MDDAVSVTQSTGLRTLARTPAEHAALERARVTLVGGAESAARILVDGSADRDAITAARDVLDRVGLSAAATAQQSLAPQEVLSATAYGALRALFDAFGIAVPDAPRADDAIAVDARVSEPASDGSVPPVEATPRRKRKRAPGRAALPAPSVKASDDDFLLQLEKNE